MFDAYFDPDHWAGGGNDWDYAQDWDALKKKLSEHSSNRWGDVVDCCITGKDADLERCGQQGFSLTDIDDKHVTITVKCGKTVSGTDVCLNVGSEIENDDEKYESAREEYLTQATEVVCEFPFPGEWSGDDWYMEHEADVKVEYTLDEELGEIDVEKTFNAMMDAYEKEVEYWDKECGIMDDILNTLSGWVEFNPETKEFERVPEKP